MGKPRAFVKRALIGGLLVVLPIAILTFFFRWIFRLVTDLIASQVELCPDIKVDSAMRTIISCGAGSSELFSQSSVIQDKQSNQ